MALSRPRGIKLRWRPPGSATSTFGSRCQWSELTALRVSSDALPFLGSCDAGLKNQGPASFGMHGVEPYKNKGRSG